MLVVCVCRWLLGYVCFVCNDVVLRCGDFVCLYRRCIFFHGVVLDVCGVVCVVCGVCVCVECLWMLVLEFDCFFSINIA